MSPAQLSDYQTILFAIIFSALILLLFVGLYAWSVVLWVTRPNEDIELLTIESFVVGAPTPLPPAHLA